MIDGSAGVLRLAAPSEGAARRGEAIITDAFRTAAVPILGPGRWLAIRRIDLGEVDAELPPAVLAQRISALLATLASKAVHLTAPTAVSADAVWAEDPVEAWAELLLRMVEKRSVQGWMWRKVAPSWTGQSDETGIAEVVRDVVQSEIGLIGTARVFELLARRDALVPVVLALRESEVLRWIRQAGWGTTLTSQERDDPSGEEASTPALGAKTLDVWGRVLAALVTAVGTDDPRLVWLSQLSVVSHRPERARDPRLPTFAHALLRHGVSLTETRRPLTPRQDPRELLRRHSPAQTVASPPERRERTAIRIDPPESVVTAASPSTVADDAVSDVPWSGAGGLLFLVHVLRRLQLPAVLDAHPRCADAQLGLHVLGRLLHILELPEDPLWSALETESDWPDLPLERPAVWSELDAPPEGPFDDAVEGWIAAMAAWCEQFAERSLEAIARRPAVVRVSRNHIDVVFSHEQADPDLRRVGLDADPGWVPWLGRIVVFHYTSNEAAWRA